MARRMKRDERRELERDARYIAERVRQREREVEAILEGEDCTLEETLEGEVDMSLAERLLEDDEHESRRRFDVDVSYAYVALRRRYGR